MSQFLFLGELFCLVLHMKQYNCIISQWHLTTVRLQCKWQHGTYNTAFYCEQQLILEQIKGLTFFHVPVSMTTQPLELSIHLMCPVAKVPRDKEDAGQQYDNHND